MGITSYYKIPKEIFPIIELDMVSVRGSYAGASAASLNSFAVTEIENELESIVGIKEVNSIVRAGSFTIIGELKDGEIPLEILNEVKDAISKARSSFPNDMEEPTATSVSRNMSLLTISIASENLNKSQLIQNAKILQKKLYKFENVNKVDIYGNTDLQIDILIDDKKLQAYGINSSEISAVISRLSHIYPVGQIEQKGNHIYLNSDNQKFDIEKWKSTIINVSGKKIYLGDIATVKIHYPQKGTIGRFNGKNSITLKLYKDEIGNAIFLADDVRKFLKEYSDKNQNLIIEISKDSSKPIQDRLNTIISNITFGLVLVGFAIFLLVSPRLSIVIVLGIPFSFIIAIIAMYYLEISLNMITLMAMLLSLGIVVDDAIIVSENIQRHIDEGMAIKDAVYIGTKEVISPVIVAAATTMFAFLPMLLMTGKMGSFIIFIPIVISILILASLIESFIFLPLHAKHILRANEKMFNWTPILNVYGKILGFLIHFKKSFLVLFFIIVPLLTIYTMKKSRFQFFPKMDSTEITLSIKLDDSLILEDTDNIAKVFEQKIMEISKKHFIKNMESVIGRFTNMSRSIENIENGFMLILELEEYRDDNFLQNYINPVFTFTLDFKREAKTRTLKSREISKNLRVALEPLTDKYNVVEMNMKERKVGIVKTDLKINLNSSNPQLLRDSISKIKTALENIDGVKEISDNAKMGKDEYKFSVNSYGESLGLSEQSIARLLSDFYLERKQTTTFNTDGIVEINTQSLYKDDLNSLKEFLIPLSENRFVKLNEVVNFKIERNFDKIEKTDLKIIKTVFANVNVSKVTATEAIDELMPTIKEVEKLGVNVVLGGEKEQKDKLKSEMGKSAIVALFLIFITLLVIFPSFKSALMILSVIPFTVFGAIMGHFIMGMNLTFPSMIGMLGLAGVVINDGIIMLDFLHNTNNKKEFFARAKMRVRPILITSITTILGLSTLIFYPTGEAIILQPIAISLGFGLAWGTILNLIYIPTLYAVMHKIDE